MKVIINNITTKFNNNSPKTIVNCLISESHSTGDRTPVSQETDEEVEVVVDKALLLENHQETLAGVTVR